MDKLELLARAWTVGTNVEGLDKIDAIRAIQTAEGFEPCFGCGCFATCGQPHCAFRADCEQITLIEDPCEVMACDIAPPGKK